MFLQQTFGDGNRAATIVVSVMSFKGVLTQNFEGEITCGIDVCGHRHIIYEISTNNRA